MDLMQILGNVGFNWQVALANFVNFLIIFYLLKRFAFGPIKKVLAERQEKIVKGLEDSQQAETAKMMAEENAKKVLSNTKKEADQIVASAQGRADDIVASAAKKAEVESEKVLAGAQKEIDKERQKMQQEVGSEAGEMAVSLAEKILAKKMDTKSDQKFIESLLN